MNLAKIRFWLCFLLVSIVITSCKTPLLVATPTSNQTPTNTLTHTLQVPKEPLFTATATVENIPIGPQTYPQNINPLTGQVVQNGENLKLPPVLVSITNFPPTARPQAGLSFSPIVFEMWIGDGMTRFLAVFYGDYPQVVQQEYGDQDTLAEGASQPVAVGPIRSGRLPYEHIRKLFNGFIVMASAYKDVAEKISDYQNIFGNDQSDPNSAMLDVTKLEQIAKSSEKELRQAALSGMYFDENPPAGGRTAHSLWLFFAYLNQVFWRYDEKSGAYLRWQDNADGSTFIQTTDRLNNQPLAFENVIVLFAEHEVQRKYLIDINLLYIKRNPALVFRDGQVFTLYWTTASEEYEKSTGKLRPIRFVDALGNPFPLKPGQTWIEIVPMHTPYWETVDSEVFHLLANGNAKGSGYWAVRFYAPK